MDDIATRRAAARRTAIVIAAVALAVYAAFLLSGWMGAL
jgi:hypothetical protein